MREQSLVIGTGLGIHCRSDAAGDVILDRVASVWIAENAIELDKALLKKWGVTENLTGVASIALGYADCDAPAPKARKEDYILRV